eukprot:gb/GFBE01059495.1/.p1 GENE.gb/GFBE01059495.1/~~gb/GFBE01059495.1/.p1  ORF type:complete len:912 (+),score=193.57 gb/GFBE01059495.1/:1-2736(+)
MATPDATLNQISLEYSHSELQQATRNFHDSHRLGYGSFGGVFKGIQRDGTEVAIKVLDVPEEAGFEEEVRVLSKFRHPNLVILMGFAKNGPQRFLVYELLAGGDLFKRLQKCAVENVPFTWKQRVSAAFDAACGLSHLHNATPKVFHRDIKCPNILLDRNGTAKMADFGLACCSHAKEQKVEQAAGTVGYACPHYVNRGVVTEGSEVYSFGIVLLELLTAAQPAYLAQAPDGSEQYQFLVTHLANDVRIAVQMADAKAQYPSEIATELASLGLRCTEYVEELRPHFAEVVGVLRTLRDAKEAPSGTPPSPAPPEQPWHLQQHRQPSPPQQHSHMPQQQQQQQHHHYLQQQQYQMQQQQHYQFQQQQQQQQLLQEEQRRQQQIQEEQRRQQQLQDEQRRQQQIQEEQRRQQHQQLQLQQFQQHHLQQQLQQKHLILQSQASAAQEQDRSPVGHLQLQPNVGQLQPISGITGSPTHMHSAHGGAVMARQPLRVAYAKPILWALECVKSECANLTVLPKEQRSLAHRREVGSQSLSTQRLGRLFQPDFCRLMLPDELFYSQVSREHFQIWAEEWPPMGGPTTHGLPCSFFLTNYGTVGTMVDGVALETRGAQMPLHNGSIIGLLRSVTDNTGSVVKVPFLEFRFSLEGSILVDAEAEDAALASATGQRSLKAELPSVPSMPSREARKSAPPDLSTGKCASSDLSLGQLGESCGDVVRGGTSFVGADVEPLFILEVGGTGIRSGVSGERRCIVHGPSVSACAAAPGCEAPCPPLSLGNGQQAGFWRKLLGEDSCKAFARHHFQIEASVDTDAAGERRFHVRNFTDLLLRVEGTAEDSSENCARLPDSDGRWQMHHGDILHLSSEKGSSVWMAFRELMATSAGSPMVEASPIPAELPADVLAAQVEAALAADAGDD